MMKMTRICTGMMMLAGVVVSAHAEISTSLKEVSIKGDATAFSTKTTPCWVREPTFFGNGGVSALSELFAEAGMNIVKDKNAACEINFRGYVTTTLGADKEKVFVMPAEWIVQNTAAVSAVSPAIVGDAKGADNAMNAMADYGKAKSAPAETAGAVAGGYMKNMGDAVGGALLGRLLDGATSKAVVLIPGIGHIKADIVYKSGGHSFSGVIDVYAASTTAEQPIDLLRATTVRIVEEIKLKNGETQTSVAETPVTAPNVH